ncbi:hypothetical protein LA345_39860 (plasmid) [Burkholderia vietnamiensis]|nr:hypothetical protein [Burkholderia vietnamiensis]
MSVAEASTSRRDHLLAAANQWREQEAFYESQATREGNPAARALARTCGDTAKSLELEADDGVARCVCCLKPFGSRRDLLPYWKR